MKTNKISLNTITNIIIVLCLLYTIILSTILYCYADDYPVEYIESLDLIFNNIENMGVDNYSHNTPQAVFENAISSNWSSQIYYRLSGTFSGGNYNDNPPFQIANNLPENRIHYRYGTDSKYIDFLKSGSIVYIYFYGCDYDDGGTYSMSFHQGTNSTFAYISTESFAMYSDTDNGRIYTITHYSSPWSRPTIDTNEFSKRVNEVVHTMNSGITLNTLSVKSGYALVCKLNTTTKFTMTTEFDTFPLFGSMYNGVGYYDYKANTFEYNNDYNVIPFTKTNINYIGRSEKTFNSQYVTIINPTTYGTGAKNKTPNTLYVNTDVNIADCRIVPLTMLSVYNGTVNNSSEQGYVTTSGSIVSVSNGTDTPTTNSAIYIQVVGGNSPEYVSQSASESTNGILKDIISTINGLFTDTSEAIKSLVDSGSALVSTIAELFNVLPTPVYNAIFSALIIIVVIGVLKVFL